MATKSRQFIKGNPQLANIPVLLLTGAFEPIDETRARAVGCDGVLVKPFEPQMVINRVKDLLAGRRSGGLWGAKPTAPAPTRDVPRPMAPPRSQVRNLQHLLRERRDLGIARGVFRSSGRGVRER